MGIYDPKLVLRNVGDSERTGLGEVSLVYYIRLPNEPVGKVLLTSENGIFGGHLTLPKHESVDCGAIYEVTFFCISPMNLLGDFFYRLNGKLNGSPLFGRSASTPGYARSDVPGPSIMS